MITLRLAPMAFFSPIWLVRSRTVMKTDLLEDDELRASFGKAAGRLQTETQDASQNGPVPARTDDRHERT